MNSDLLNELPSAELQHESNFDAYDALYGESAMNDGEANEEELDEDEFARLASYSRGSLLDIVYVGKAPQESEGEGEREEDEEEEEEQTVGGDLEDERFSAASYEQRRFRYAALSERERQQIAQKVRELRSEAKVLTIVNKFLHRNYIDINRKSPSMANALDKFDESIVFEDTRYQASLQEFARIRDDVNGRTASLGADLQSLESSRSSAEGAYAEAFERLLAQQWALAKKTKPPKCAKQAWLAQAEQLLDNQRQRAAELARIHLAHVHLQAKLAKLTATSRKFDSLGAGFSMMDYEYLLKRKDVYSERRDEQQQHIKRLGHKNLTSAAIIRHVDEEVDLYDDKVTQNSHSLETLVLGNKSERAKAAQLAKSKVLISKSMDKLKQQIGLLSYPFLLRKMERDLREIAKLNKRSDGLQAKMRADAAKHRSFL